jgi:DNA-binding transcriptional ArsR family regulator
MASTTPKTAAPKGPSPELRRLAELLKTARSPSAVRILFALAGGERTTGVLAEDARSSQANIANVLARLRLVGLVDRRREGQLVRYSLTDRGRAVVAAVEVAMRRR